ncbi:MAG: methyltransferase domain-containing protein, partial [Muribaculaceae bacterium]|nr:methyltransferase domain-containing protein [Muribaculaceae bacterium]
RELPDNSINLIVSSATLQWFNSPIAALRQIQRILTPGGIAAIALYTEGTLARLAATTGISLNYVSEALLANAVKQPCVIEFIETETLRTDFDSTRKLLEHLRSTGVDGVGHAPSSSLRNLLRENSLLSLQFNSTTLIIRKQ